MERLLVARVPSSESIGACSLDVDASESSAVLAARTRPMGKEASEITLRSMAVSATTTAQEGGPTQQPRGGGSVPWHARPSAGGGHGRYPLCTPLALLHHLPSRLHPTVSRHVWIARGCTLCLASRTLLVLGVSFVWPGLREPLPTGAVPLACAVGE